MGLCLTLREGEALKIGGDIIVKYVVRNGAKQIRVLVIAPRELNVKRIGPYNTTEKPEGEKLD